MRVQSFVTAVTVALGVLSGGLPARADAAADIDGCIQETDVILRIESCTRIIKSEALTGKELAWAFNNRGLAYEQVRRPERALGDYNTALLLDPNYSVGFNNRGNVLASMGDIEGAIADHTRAIEIDPTYAHAYYNRGADFEELGDMEAALRDYSRAVEADPTYTLAQVSRAAANCSLENVDAAVADQLALLESGHFTAVQMQEYLSEKGFYTSTVDGIFGRGSRAALQAWVEAKCP
ncbi:MAG: tetratricopeptide repeat protein [Pseudomonadota bacterium]